MRLRPAVSLFILAAALSCSGGASPFATPDQGDVPPDLADVASEFPDGLPACPAGFESCGSACVDLSKDPGHCGICEKACASGELCSNGTCCNRA